jgi:hypothetical protein
LLFVNQTKAVLLLKRHIAADESPMVEVPVDKALQEIQIDIQGNTAMPYPVIRKPNSKFVVNQRHVVSGNIASIIVSFCKLTLCCIKLYTSLTIPL